MPGVDTWLQPQNEAPIIGGVQFKGAPIQMLPVEGGTHRLTTASGKSILQRAFLGTGREVAPSFFQFSWRQDWSQEVEVRKLDSLRSHGIPFAIIPHATVSETFEVAAGINTLTLTRTEAKGATGFNATAHPNTAFLNQTSQTVVAATPSAGQIQIVGTTVTTPTLVAGDVVEIVYYPSFTVGVQGIPQAFIGFNLAERDITLWELPA